MMRQGEGAASGPQRSASIGVPVAQQLAANDGIAGATMTAARSIAPHCRGRQAACAQGMQSAQLASASSSATTSSSLGRVQATPGCGAQVARSSPASSAARAATHDRGRQASCAQGMQSAQPASASSSATTSSSPERVQTTPGCGAQVARSSPALSAARAAQLRAAGITFVEAVEVHEDEVSERVRHHEVQQLERDLIERERVRHHEVQQRQRDLIERRAKLVKQNRRKRQVHDAEEKVRMAAKRAAAVASARAAAAEISAARARPSTPAAPTQALPRTAGTPTVTPPRPSSQTVSQPRASPLSEALPTRVQAVAVSAPAPALAPPVTVQSHRSNLSVPHGVVRGLRGRRFYGPIVNIGAFVDEVCVRVCACVYV
jgi:hypothetical protein